MMLYGMYSGGVMRYSGTTRTGQRCKRKGYTIDRGRGYYCPYHQEAPDAV
jgi:hypothetical protein